MQSRRYTKQRDKPVRRLSPRTDNETDGEGEVEVETYGEGNITSEYEPSWPQNFESVGNVLDKQYEDVYAATNTSSPMSPWKMPERAQKYMVKSSSLKDLTRDKFITVPESKPGKSDAKEAVRSSSSLQNLSTSDERRSTSIPNAIVKPTARVEGTYRGVPTFPEHTKSHIATVRVHPRQSHKIKHATIKAIPRNGTIKTVKAYNIAHNASLRLHNTVRLAKQKRHSDYSMDKHSGTVGFRRGTTMYDKKEYCFSEFGIELDHSHLDTFAPGDTITGRVILEANSNVEIRFVELLIVGVASVHFAKNDPNIGKDAQEILINKRSYVMGSPEGRWNSIIAAGRYVSRFKFVLPESLPSTIKYENRLHGFGFEVAYIIKARICDDMGSSSTRSTHSTNNLVKVLLSRRHPFHVRRPFDIHSVPKALMPVSHSEYINLSCMPLMFDNTNLTLSLDRSVFLAGDEIHVKLVTTLNTAKKLKSLTCELHQKVFSNIKPRQLFTIMQIHEREPEGILFKQDNKDYIMFEFIIPTTSQFIPTYMTGTKLLKVTYSVLVIAKFTSCSGKLFLESNVGIGPYADPINFQRTNSVPIFNRPKRFPHFSKDNPGFKTQNGTANVTKGRREVTVVNKSEVPGVFCC